MEEAYLNREYLILPVSELTKVNFNQILETSAESLRKSVDGTKPIIKWENTQPAFISTLLNTEGPYTYEEIMNIIHTPAWTKPRPNNFI